jgi:DNA repair exonuclease SbcCD ATPase subunit
MSFKSQTLKVAPKVTTRTPERSKLAEALQARETAERRLLAAQTAVTRMADRIRDCSLQAEDAGVLVERCLKAAEAAEAATAAGEKQPETTLSLREAKQRQSDAIERLEIARGALSRVEAELAAPEAALTNARRNVEEAVDTVIRSEIDIDRFFSEIKKIQGRLAGLRLSLRWAACRSLPIEGSRYRNPAPIVVDEKMQKEIIEFLDDPSALPMATFNPPGQDLNEAPTTVALEAAREALMRGELDTVLPLPTT